MAERESERIPWLFWPFVVLWRFFAGVFGVAGRLVAITLGLVLIAIGALLSMTGVLLPLGVAMILLGFLLVVRGFF